MTHSPMHGVVVAKHALVVRLMRGVYNALPSHPRYMTTWDVGAGIASSFISGEEQRPQFETAFSQTCSTASTCQLLVEHRRSMP